MKKLLLLVSLLVYIPVVLARVERTARPGAGTGYTYTLYNKDGQKRITCVPLDYAAVSTKCELDTSVSDGILNKSFVINDPNNRGIYSLLETEYNKQEEEKASKAKK